ncbi:GTP-binding protein [Candidatus Woesearchaeota archaeon]|nr:GTP-binding protein [Candidatus Woesearchaeota archaeon]
MSDQAIRDRIKEFEEELKNTKYNKRTQHHIGLVKAKIATLKEKIEQRKKGKGKTTGYSVKRTGDATAVLVGFPSVGKSTLLNKITNADSKVGEYDFTTLTVIPGLLEYNHAKIQILDVPGIIQGAADGSGRGKEVLAAVRSADIIIILLDINQLHHLKIIEKELYEAGIRLNQKKPDIRIRKKSKDGIRIGATVKLDIEEETIKAILQEFRITNADVLIRSEINEDQLIDAIETNRIYIPGIIVINKSDTATIEDIKKVEQQYKDALVISAKNEDNLDKLTQTIFEKLELIRIYLKKPGKEADLKEPLVLRHNSSLRDLCEKIHRDFVTKFKFARVWGATAKYNGQMISRLDKELHDRDIVELHMR